MGEAEKVPRARRRLWLRAEQAFGLHAVVGAIPGAETQLLHAAEPANAPPESAAVTGAAPPDLFGGSATAAPIAPTSPIPSQEMSSDHKRRILLEMDESEVRGCTKCRLCEARTNTVFGEGAADASVFFIGEGPGETEDRTGRPFVGRAGELLDRMIRAMGLSREQVYIANIVKCRPPGNREPAPDEVATCTAYLVRQIEIIRPRAIVTLGRPATQYMLGQKVSITKMRGQWQSWRGIPLMPTYHPAYILRSYTEQVRSAVWGDLQEVMRVLELPLPPRAARDGRAVAR